MSKKKGGEKKERKLNGRGNLWMFAGVIYHNEPHVESLQFMFDFKKKEIILSLIMKSHGFKKI